MKQFTGVIRGQYVNIHNQNLKLSKNIFFRAVNRLTHTHTFVYLFKNVPLKGDFVKYFNTLINMGVGKYAALCKCMHIFLLYEIN